MTKSKKIYVDLDETLCYYENERLYPLAKPLIKNICKINKLFDEEHQIYIWTARGSETKIDYFELTKTQLSQWNIKYHHLIMGKPSYDIYIDDKSINSIYEFNDKSIENILTNVQYKYLQNNAKLTTTDFLLKQKNQIDDFFFKIKENQFDELIDIIEQHNFIYTIGIGKNDNMAKHVSDILKSINIKVNNLNAVNLSHGDIGGVIDASLILCFSKSGNTEELFIPLNLLKNKDCKIVLISSRRGNLFSLSDYWFEIPCTEELDKFNTLPTSSFAYYSIFCNILVSMLIERKNMNINDYKHNHISGDIGRKLFTTVKSVYKKKKDLTCHINYNEQLTCADIIFTITDGKIGLCVLLNTNDTIYGIVTDGTIRLYMMNNNLYDLSKIKIDDMINKNPNVITNLNMTLKELEKVNYKYIPVVINNIFEGVYKSEKY